MTNRSLPFLSLLLAATLGSPAFASNSQPTPLGETIDVTVVNVEAVVTDRFGVRVAGMKKSDFRLLVDGVETEIEFFSEVHGGDVVERSESDTDAAGETD